MWQQLKKNFLDKAEFLTIKQKLKYGFGTLLTFMVVIIIINLISLLIIRNNIKQIMLTPQKK